MLAVILSNRGFLDESHARVEASVPLYRAGHEAMTIAGGQLSDAGATAALDHGIGVYEVIAMLVRPTTSPSTDPLRAYQRAIELAITGGDSFLELIEDAERSLRSTLPRVGEVVMDTADRLHPHMGEYALRGAALACWYELAA